MYLRYEEHFLMTILTQSELAEHLSETLAKLASDGDPVLIEDIAVLISADEYRLLRQIEDRNDLAEMAKVKAASEGTVPYDEGRKELGL
jgi:PHD/YefM family antitoxin component YafN of YafNO toxin-antitoxin module